MITVSPFGGTDTLSMPYALCIGSGVGLLPVLPTNCWKNWLVGLSTVPLTFWSRGCCVTDLGREQAPISVSRTCGTAPELIYKNLLEHRINAISLDLQVEGCEQASVVQTNRPYRARTTNGVISDVKPVIVKGLYPRRQTLQMHRKPEKNTTNEIITNARKICEETHFKTFE